MPRLTVRLLAKNEEENLSRALDSVAPIADEIIVTDTGSTDRTVDIARDHGARVDRFTWIDDFAAAHNHGDAQATGDWIFLLDADEELLTESHDELRAAIHRDDVLGYTVLRQDLVDAKRHDQFSEMLQLRLYRNHPDLTYIGRCHFQFNPPLQVTAARLGLQVVESKIRIRHYGFIRELRQQKNERAIRLLELELADRPGQFYYLVELGRTLLATGQQRGLTVLAEAAQQVAPLANHPSADTDLPHGTLGLLLEFVLAAPKLPADFPLTKDAARRLTLARYGASIPLLWHIARADFAAADFPAAAKLLEQIVALADENSYDRAVSFDPKLLGDDARLNLAVCYVRLGKLKQALAVFEALTDSPTQGPAAKQNLTALKKLLRQHRA